ncbi:hypothetical protein HMPREF1380_02473 [Enterococcus faecium R499]|uniref:Uncharacterized protein n=1 Tax=Enterococcus faecium SD2A-2 TaxID=1244154 RepID=A0AB73ABB8_ENTFC|nr:hypothetical protein HMPREF9525_01766 [Enterococcus faecium TX0133a04]EJX36897.1 hypothetical protein HMPREF1381_03305 [Enterococcus faecium R501]EJX46826.1 hypothetical protein HMPREF1380_02473 [Enterococcus faecium R499]EJX48832.1 hypothetical protein HMPREF1379_02698 [Enterococcus faecium R497]EJX53548.1 hypothetical protein HMPREF1377_02871 [Enterococcus faecium R494]EJX69514.1 hypothetical protein HMPREF1373_02217 [Enterococcus faecium P1140]EJX91675.1 hypothetical protein HMPREF1365_
MSCFARPFILVNVQRSLPFFSNGGGGWSERGFSIEKALAPS